MSYSSSPVLTGYKSVDESRTNTATRSADTSLVLRLDGYTTYHIKSMLHWTTATGNPGINQRIGITVGFLQALKGTVMTFDAGGTLIDSTIGTGTSKSLVAGDYFTLIDASLITSIAPTVFITWGQFVSSPDATTLNNGSYIIATKLK